MKLSEIDRVYEAVRSEMSVTDKITYCSRLIYRTHLQLSRTESQLTRETRQHTLKLLQYARYELDELLRSTV